MNNVRKLLISLACVLALGAGSSLAQSNNIYGAGSLGLDIPGNAVFNLNGYLGFEDLLAQNIGLRSSLGLLIAGNVAVQVGSDVLFAFPLENGDITIFAGGGPRVIFGGGGTNVALGTVGNFDYAIQPNLSIFGEFDLDLYLLGGVSVVPGIEAGVRFKF